VSYNTPPRTTSPLSVATGGAVVAAGGAVVAAGLVAAGGATVGCGAVVGVAQPIISAPNITNAITANVLIAICFFIEPSLTNKMIVFVNADLRASSLS
jgi:hypothetical protein